MDLSAVHEIADRLRRQIGAVVVDQQRAIDHLMIALLAEGHVLLEGVPGTAKTLLARVFAASLDLEFKRIQFTPDLMPGDVLGTNVYDFQSREFVLTRGPVFTQILLADELNRTPPKTQSALLQAMQERVVTIDGASHELGAGFMVIATQNPIEHEGTYPLPEAQLDRFMVKIDIGYPDREHERHMVRLHGHTASLPQLAELGVERVASLDDICAARAVVAGLTLADDVLDYVVDVIRATREHPSLLAGASPRATNVLCLAARARAALDGRDYVIPDDVKALLEPVLAHRLVMAPGSELDDMDVHAVLAQVVDQVAAPR